MVSWLQKISSENESSTEGENDENDCSKLSLIAIEQIGILLSYY